MSRAPVAAARVPAPTLTRPRSKPAPARPVRRAPAPKAAERSLERVPVLAPPAVGRVRRVDLPYRTTLESAFDQPLGGVEVLTGLPVAEWLADAGADAATIGDVVLLADVAAPFETVAHEVVHVLQNEAAGAPSPPAADPIGLEFRVPDILPADHPAEAEAGAVENTAPSAPVHEAMPAGTVALRRSNIPKTPSPAAPTEEDTFTQELAGERATTTSGRAAEEATGEAEVAAVSAEQREAEGEPQAEAAPDEVPAPTFELPQAPETALSAEELAARQAEAEAAEAALAQADEASGVVAAYATAPPTVKAAVQGTIGGRIGEVAAADQEDFQSGLPEFHATMGGGELAEPEAPVAETAAETEAPAPEPVVLEAETPPPAPEPALPAAPAPEPYDANDGVGSMLSRLFGTDAASAVAQSLNAVQTTDPSIETSAGERPAVPLEGDADPARLDEQMQAGAEHAQAEREAASQAVIDGRGPEQVQLRQMDELVPTGEPAAAELAGLAGSPEADGLAGMGMPEEVLAQFDADTGAAMQASLDDAQTQFAQAETDRDTQRDEAVATAVAERDRVTAEADDAQRTQVQTARDTIQTERETTIEAQQAAVDELEMDAEQARGEQQTAIETRVTEDEGKISAEYDQAEIDAKAEVETGEEKAEAERAHAEEQAEEESWWDAAVSFVKDVFDKLTSVINSIFDAVRSAVKGILDAVRDFAKGLIDLAADFVKGAIAFYATALKGLIDVTVGQVFPDLAADLNAGIDGAVELANTAVDAVAETLKTGVDLAVDNLNAAIDYVITMYQSAVNAALAIMEAAITGDWTGLAKKLLEAVLHLLGIDPAEFYAFIGTIIDTVDLIISDPLAFLGNLVNAVLLGFQKFADNLLTHLQVGIISWLTGALGGIQIPAAFDLFGVLDLARQILGLTWDWLREKAVRLVGEQNVARIEFILSYVTTLVEGGFPALWERIKQDLGGLVDTVIGAISEFIVQKVVIAGITWLASLFSPVGAVVKLVLTIWNLYLFVRDQLARIIQIAETVVQGIANIARGVIEAAALRVESALATLLPVAIDLVAKLLGLTGVAAKVREILARVREWVDNAVNTLLDKVLKAFTGKGQAAVDPAQPGEVPETGIGDSLTVPVEDGPDHTLTIAVTGTNATAMLASNELPVKTWLAGFRDQLKGFDEGKRATADKELTAAEDALKKLDPEADKLAAATAGGAEPPKKTEDDVKADQEALRKALIAVFPLFGGREKDPIVGIFADDIKRAHEKATDAIGDQLREGAVEFQTMTWAQVREQILIRNAGKENTFGRPLLSRHVFGAAGQEAVDEILTSRGYIFETEDKENNYYSHWLVPRVNTPEEAVFAAAKSDLQRIIFEGGKIADSSALVEAAIKAHDLQDEAKDSADADLLEHAKDIIAFLLAMASRQDHGALKFTDWESRFWGLQNNRLWIQARFRAKKPGKHEWILTHLIDQVIERHRESVATYALPTTASWFQVQDALRTPTEFVILPLDSARKAKYRRERRPPHDKLDDSGGQVLQGHPGAIYAPIGPGGEYRDDVVQQTEGSPGWHKRLENIFTGNPGASLEAMQTILSGIDKFWKENLWFGAEADLGFDEYYSKAKKKADGEDMVEFSTLQGVGQEAFKTITDNFSDARGLVKP